jgi:SAM-dependent methyltransferase
MEENLDSVVKSLSGNSNELLEYLPYLLQDLFELGGDGNIAVSLLENNFSQNLSNINVLDLCCGKGAALIKFAQTFNCKGVGIDLFPSFINDAKKYSVQFNLQNNLNFYVMDLREAVTVFKKFDLVIFGNDTDVIGDEISSLEKIKKCCNTNGFIMYDYINILNSEFKIKLEKIGLKVVDSILIEKNEIKLINKENNRKIKHRADELSLKFPLKKHLFNEYVIAQEKESLEFEEETNWTKLLIQKV